MTERGVIDDIVSKWTNIFVSYEPFEKLSLIDQTSILDEAYNEIYGDQGVDQDMDFLYENADEILLIQEKMHKLINSGGYTPKFVDDFNLIYGSLCRVRKELEAKEKLISSITSSSI